MLDIEQFANTGELFDGRYKLLQTLSTDGGSADVWLALDVNTVNTSSKKSGSFDDNQEGLRVAIKIYRPKNALDIEGEEKFREEYKIVYNCHHANLLQPTNFSIFLNTPYLVLPYCQKGSSELYVGSGLTDDMLWHYIKDVASGLSYLHKCQPPIIHQDIKPANVMINDDDSFAITDFGISAQFDGKHEYYCDDDSGTFAYMAPERFLDNPVPQKACDIWGLGATLFELVVGHVPYGEDGGQNQPDAPVNLDFEGCHISSDIKKLIIACLNYNPEARPTADELVIAAENRNFNHSKLPKVLKWGSVFLVMVLVAFAVTKVVIGKKDNVNLAETKTLSFAESFERITPLLNSDNEETFRKGLVSMDSLANLNYIPALYEMGFTYGWYSDSASLKRKDFLGIKYNKTKYPQYLPLDKEYNEKAQAYFIRIITSPDSTFDSIKAQAYYRLAAYYVSDNKAYATDYKSAVKYLLESQTYAVKCNDVDLMQKIEESLQRIKAAAKNK